MKDQARTYGQVREIPSNVEETRTITFIASSSARDRHHSILNQKNWQLDNFNNNPIIGYQHNVYGDPCKEDDPDNVIGKGRAYVEGDLLLVDVTFETKDINQKADKIFRKILAGTLRAVSVGFLPVGQGHWGEGEEAQGKSNETYYFAGQQLLELSVVNIPSNPEAIKKQLRSNTFDAIKFIKGHLPNLSLSDIEKMSVGEVMKSLEKKIDRAFASPPSQIKPENKTMTNKKGNAFARAIRGILDAWEGKEKRITVTAADGTILDIDREEGEPQVGDSVTVDGQPANGEFVLEDGTVIVCAEGVITEIREPVEAESTETEPVEETKKLTAENKRLLEEVKSLKEENDELVRNLEEFKTRLTRLSSNYKPKEKETSFNGRGAEGEEPENRVKAARERRLEKEKQTQSTK